MQFEVARPFPGPAGMCERGMVVDGATFRDRNLHSLVTRRYLMPLVARQDAPATAGAPIDTSGDDDMVALRRGRGRPPGAKNKPKPVDADV